MLTNMFIGPLPNSLPRLDVRGLLPRDVHRHERIEVEVGIDGDCTGFLFGELSLGTGRHERCEDCKCADDRFECWSFHGSPFRSVSIRVSQR